MTPTPFDPEAAKELAEQVASVRAALNAGSSEALEWVKFGEVNGIDLLALLDSTDAAISALAHRSKDRVAKWPTNPDGSANVAYCPEHGLHGQRETCFECGEPVEQIPMVSVFVIEAALVNRDTENQRLREALDEIWTVWSKTDDQSLLTDMFAAALAETPDTERGAE